MPNISELEELISAKESALGRSRKILSDLDNISDEEYREAEKTKIQADIDRLEEELSSLQAQRESLKPNEEIVDKIRKYESLESEEKELRERREQQQRELEEFRRNRPEEPDQAYFDRLNEYNQSISAISRHMTSIREQMDDLDKDFELYSDDEIDRAISSLDNSSTRDVFVDGTENYSEFDPMHHAEERETAVEDEYVDLDLGEREPRTRNIEDEYIDLELGEREPRTRNVEDEYIDLELGEREPRTRNVEDEYIDLELGERQPRTEEIGAEISQQIEELEKLYEEMIEKGNLEQEKVHVYATELAEAYTKQIRRYETLIRKNNGEEPEYIDYLEEKIIDATTRQGFFQSISESTAPVEPEEENLEEKEVSEIEEETLQEQISINELEEKLEEARKNKEYFDQEALRFSQELTERNQELIDMITASDLDDKIELKGLEREQATKRLQLAIEKRNKYQAAVEELEAQIDEMRKQEEQDELSEMVEENTVENERQNTRSARQLVADMDRISGGLQRRQAEVDAAIKELEEYRSGSDINPFDENRTISAEEQRLINRVNSARRAYDRQYEKLKDKQEEYIAAAATINAVGTEKKKKLINAEDGSLIGTRPAFTDASAKVEGQIDGSALRNAIEPEPIETTPTGDTNDTPDDNPTGGDTGNDQPVGLIPEHIPEREPIDPTPNEPEPEESEDPEKSEPVPEDPEKDPEGPEQPEIPEKDPEEPESIPTEPEPDDPEKGPEEPTKKKGRVLEQIKVDILTDKETGEPIGITHIQRKRAERSKISVTRSFVNDVKYGGVLYDVTSIAGAIFHFPLAVVQKLTGKLLTTRRTLDNMEKVRQNIRNLPDEDKRVLFEEYKNKKAHQDRDRGIDGIIREEAIAYMREKEIAPRVNEAGNIFTEIFESYKLYKKYEVLIDKLENGMPIEVLKKIPGFKVNVNATREELIAEMRRVQQVLVEGKAEKIARFHQLNDELADLYGGGGIHGIEEEERSKATKMNEKGRRFATDVSTAEDFEGRKMRADIEQGISDAIDEGKDLEAMLLFVKGEQYKKQASKKGVTFIRILKGNPLIPEGIPIFPAGIGEKGTINYIPIAKEMDYRPDPFIRNLITTVAVAGTIAHAIGEIRDHMRAVEANKHNQEFEDNTHKIGRSMESKKDELNDGMDARREGDFAARRNHDEMNDTYYTDTGNYGINDPLHHHQIAERYQEVNQQIQDIQDQVMKGTMSEVDALKEISRINHSVHQEYVEALKDSLPGVEEYAKNHPEFDYSVLVPAMKKIIANPDASFAEEQALIETVQQGIALQGMEVAILPTNLLHTIIGLGGAALITGYVASQGGKGYKDEKTSLEDYVQDSIDFDQEIEDGIEVEDMIEDNLEDEYEEEEAKSIPIRDESNEPEDSVDLSEEEIEEEKDRAMREMLGDFAPESESKSQKL